MNEWDKPYLCLYDGKRFTSYPELCQYLMDEYGFKPTAHSHETLYWRRWYIPLSEQEKKLEMIKDLLPYNESDLSMRGKNFSQTNKTNIS